jgi:hypothetical protein
LIAMIPCVLSRKWRFSPRQSVTGVMMTLALAAVIFCSFYVLPTLPAYNPLFGAAISPEDQRPRGGGAGASAINRPVAPIIHSKLPEARHE